MIGGTAVNETIHVTRTTETIAAIATPAGFGAIGIVRVSGSLTVSIVQRVLGQVLPPPRTAYYGSFYDAQGVVIDQGIALYFPAPRSFTGEDVLELQAHGGPVVLDLILATMLAFGARLAKAGEFTERAFLNGKLDLTQAEAIADLITSTTAAQARLASRSLQGFFAREIEALAARLDHMRVFVEAHLDFPDDEVALTSDAFGIHTVKALRDDYATLLQQAQQGQLVRDGAVVVIAGSPNAGKSSLLNRLSGQDRAIVTAIPGTTRDVLTVDIQLDGLPVTIVDTAGLRASTDDPIEQEGMARTRRQLAQAALILWVRDISCDSAHVEVRPIDVPPDIPVTMIGNKSDLTTRPAGCYQYESGQTDIVLSAKTGAGIDALRDHLKLQLGYQQTDTGLFSARRRHITALEQGLVALDAAVAALLHDQPMEVLAEELRQAHQVLGEITGVMSHDELLGRIFSEFCIGK
jgi:tRNA modification GTPase